ncbi:Rubrerythrin [Desulfacinum hydrothermale DSM 13146]|uniref:Rubrerythrin n=1 Tax=Desulfacinum hydrothermale DSM 13146 TaxID=1121390 RepID=A0A1W1XA94_9BACT|nr:ferritin family protein [Desulfacinum hydrothermale]SMC20747.1 Rubrerythrin [Desulfacinum hydrothermale DSM 13146]
MSHNKPLIKVFEYALNQEETGKLFFQTALQRLGMGAAVSAFRRLIAEEEKHIAFINRILDELHQGREVDPGQLQDVILEPTDYFDERAKKEFLEQCIQGSMVPDVTVFNTAWLIEKDLSEFYAGMAEKAVGKTKSALEMLSKWERQHELFFRQFRDKLSETYAQMPWGG